MSRRDKRQRRPRRKEPVQRQRDQWPTLANVLKRNPKTRWAVRLAVLAVLVFIVFADRLGYLGYDGDDWTRYHDKTFTVLRVIDGDTLDIAAPDGEHTATRVRLWGLDTPEKANAAENRPAEPFAEQALAFTLEHCEGRSVTLHLESHRIRGNYGRLLAHVELSDGRYLNELLLQQGFARADDRWYHDRLDRYDMFEEDAKQNRRGMWGSSE